MSVLTITTKTDRQASGVAGVTRRRKPCEGAREALQDADYGNGEI